MQNVASAIFFRYAASLSVAASHLQLDITHQNVNPCLYPITCLIVISGQPILLQAATFSAVRITLKSEKNWKTTKQRAAASWYSLGSNLVIFISIIGSFDLIVPSSKVSNHIKIRFTHNILSS